MIYLFLVKLTSLIAYYFLLILTVVVVVVVGLPGLTNNDDFNLF